MAKFNGMEERLRCLVKIGDWGVAYGVAWQVLTWGKITYVSPDQKEILMEMQVNKIPNNNFERKYVEIFFLKELAEEKFNRLRSIRSEGG